MKLIKNLEHKVLNALNVNLTIALKMDIIQKENKNIYVKIAVQVLTLFVIILFIEVIFLFYQEFYTKLKKFFDLTNKISKLIIF